MKFKILILEGKQELLAKYGNKISPEIFSNIYNQIPEKLKGYGDWIFKNVLIDKNIDVHRVIQSVEIFNKYKNANKIENKDINFYDTLEDLESVISSAKEIKSKSEKEYDAKVFYENNDYKVIVPLTHEASRHYGTGTHWCTATSNPQNFINYTEVIKNLSAEKDTCDTGTLYYIIPKDNNLKKKYAIRSLWGMKWAWLKANYVNDLRIDKYLLKGYDYEDNWIDHKNVILILQKLNIPKEIFSPHQYKERLRMSPSVK